MGWLDLRAALPEIRREKLDQELPMSVEEWAYLVSFVAAAQFRTRSSRDHHAGQWQSVLNVMDEITERMKLATPEQKRIAAVSGSLSARDKSLSHDQVRKLAKAPLQLMMPGMLRSVTPILLRMNMLILCTDNLTGFITSDCPVTWFDPEDYKRPPLYRSPALGSPTIEVTMPLSPRQCLIFAWRCPNGYVPASPFALDEINRRHRSLCGEHFVVRSNTKNDYWFKESDLPDDAWEKRHPQEKNS